MFRDARTVEPGTSLDTDVCVVGTGAAGVTCAMELATTGLRVLVLEAGGFKPDASSSALADLDSVGLPIAPSSRERFYGGTTNSWWGKVGLLDELDLAGTGEAPSGWPLRYDELLPYFRRACEILGMPDVTGFASRLPAGLLASRELDVKAFFWTRRPLNFGDVHRRTANRYRNVSTLLNANVVEVEVGEGSVERLLVATVDGRRFSVRPRVTILGCGGIENARLLLNSRSRHPAGVGNNEDQVGRYFMDHPRGPCGRVETTADVSGLSPAYWSGKRFGSIRYRLGVSLSAGERSRLGLLNSYVNLSPVYGEVDGVEAIRNVYRRGPAALRDRATRRAIARGVPDIARYLRFKRYGRGRVRALAVENYMEQEPQASNRVTLSERRDPFGYPLARVDSSLSERDRRTVRTLHATLGDELAQRGVGRLRSPLLSEDAGEWPVTNGAAHHMGGTRMGFDPRSSVLDPASRVHGIDNLYVAGSSVFPTGGSANPTLTIVALAARVAAQVRAGLLGHGAIDIREAAPTAPVRTEEETVER